MFRAFACLAAAVLVRAGRSETASPGAGIPVVWRLDDPRSVAGLPTEVVGAPRILRDSDGAYAAFDGRKDGFIVKANPLAGWAAFTVEVRFRPDAGGEPAQRFVHIEDVGQPHRAMIEIRLNDSQWAVDTFLVSEKGRLPLFDPKRLHRAGTWHWAALRFDGKWMSSFVDGRPELGGAVSFSPMTGGQIGLGLRINRVYWFKGGIREIRFTPDALAESALQK